MKFIDVILTDSIHAQRHIYSMILSVWSIRTGKTDQ